MPCTQLAKPDGNSVVDEPQQCFEDSSFRDPLLKAALTSGKPCVSHPILYSVLMELSRRMQ